MADAVFLANLPDGPYHDRLRLTDDEDLAAEVFPDHGLENVAGLDPVGAHTEHEQIRLVDVKHAGQVAGLTAFAGDESKIIECVRQEQSKVFLAVDDAGARRQLAVPERTGVHIPVKVDLTHLRPPTRQIPRTQSYIRDAAAMMEFCRWSEDYFSKVKAEN